MSRRLVSRLLQCGLIAAAIGVSERSLADEGGDIVFARQVSRGNIAANFTGNLNANLKADADLGFGAVDRHTSPPGSTERDKLRRISDLALRYFGAQFFVVQSTR